MVDQASTDHFVAANLRRNFVANIFDIGFFMLGLSLVSQTTVVPLLVSHLTDSKLALGLVPALNSLGLLLPQLLIANYTEGLRRKMPFVASLCLLQRLSVPIIGVALLVFAIPAPAIALVAVLGLRAAGSAAAGTIIPAWFDVVAKEIPARKRGLYSGLSNAVGALLGVGGALLAVRMLSAWPYPLNFAACFFASFGLSMISWVALTCNREPASPVVQHGRRLASHLRGLPALLSANRNFRRYLITRSVVVMGSMGVGFFMVYGAERFGMAEREAGLLTALLVGSQAVANLALGPLADRYGHKRVLIGEALCMALAAAVAWAAAAPVWIGAVFVLLGVGTAAGGVSSATIVLEFGGPADRPTYIGLTNTALAPMSVLAPILGGWLATWVGLSGMFLAATVLAIVGALMMATWVQEPRSHAGGRGAEVSGSESGQTS